MPDTHDDLLMSRHPRVKLGDMLSIPLSEAINCCGQVIQKRISIYVVVFDGLYAEAPNLNRTIFKSPIIAGWTEDAEIYFKKWKIIGNVPPYDNGNLRKNSKIIYDGNVWVESFEGKLLHKATETEVNDLRNWTSYSPALFEDAIRAFHGLGPWHSYFDGLLIGNS